MRTVSVTVVASVRPYLTVARRTIARITKQQRYVGMLYDVYSNILAVSKNSIGIEYKQLDRLKHPILSLLKALIKF